MNHITLLKPCFGMQPGETGSAKERIKPSGPVMVSWDNGKTCLMHRYEIKIIRYGLDEVYILSEDAP